MVSNPYSVNEARAHGGLTDVVGEAVSNWRLIPGATGESVDGSVMLIGYINMGLLGELLDFEYIPSSFTQFLSDARAHNTASRHPTCNGNGKRHLPEIGRRNANGYFFRIPEGHRMDKV